MATQDVKIRITALDKTSGALRNIGGALRTVTKPILNLRTALVGLLGAGGMGLLVSQSLKATDALAKTSARIGTTTDQLSKLQFAGSLAGVETNTLNMAMQRFVRRTAEATQGTGEAVRAFQQLKIDAKDLQEVPLAERMKVLAQAFGELETEEQKLAVAFKLFDSEGTAVINMLRQSGDEMEAVFQEAQKLGIVMSQDAAKGVEDANDAFTRLRAIGQGLTNQFTAALAPALTSLTTAFKNFILEQSEAHGGIENFARFIAGKFIEDIRSALVGLQALTNAGIDIVNTFNSARRSLSAAFAIGKADPNDVAALEAELAEIDQMLRGGFFNDLGKIRLFSDEGVIDILSDEELLAERERIVDRLEELGVDINEAIPYVNFADRLAVPLAEAAEAAKAPIESLKSTLEEVKVIAQAPWYMPLIDGFKKFGTAIDTVIEKMPVIDQALEQFTQQAMNNFTQAFTDAVTGAKNFGEAMKGLAKSVVDSLIKMLVQYYITKPLFDAISGGISGAFSGGTAGASGGGTGNFAGNFNGGGFTGYGARAGGVDGKGGFPAILHPNESVIDHTRGQGAGVVVNQTINVTTGVQQTVRAEIANLLPQISNAAKAAVADSKMRGGGFSKAMVGA